MARLSLSDSVPGAAGSRGAGSPRVRPAPSPAFRETLSRAGRSSGCFGPFRPPSSGRSRASAHVTCASVVPLRLPPACEALHVRSVPNQARFLAVRPRRRSGLRTRQETRLGAPARRRSRLRTAASSRRLGVSWRVPRVRWVRPRSGRAVCGPGPRLLPRPRQGELAVSPLSWSALGSAAQAPPAFLRPRFPDFLPSGPQRGFRNCGAFPAEKGRGERVNG